MFLLLHSQYVSAQVGHHQMIREEYTIYTNIVVLYEFRHNCYIPHDSPHDGPSWPKLVVSGTIKTFACVKVIPLFLLLR
jgi:hypothetical protein